MNDIVYIHYGATHFDENLFEDIKNIPFVKPEGGLWASRVDAKRSWKEWTEDNEYMTDRYREDNSFKFILKKGARILTLKTKADLKNLPMSKIPTLDPTLFNWLNFEKLQEQYDAIEVYIDNLYWDLYGWDCDSLLVLNKNIVEQIY